MSTVFLSDLHLEADRPYIADQFLRFLETDALKADALYILGDLFESWVGDDDPNEHYQWIKQALKKFTRNDIPTYFMHGNRDFMIGDQFSEETGVQLLNDPYLIELYGEQVLLAHGDAYCIDDQEYQAIRMMTRNPEWQVTMRAKPLEERLMIATAARQASQERYQSVDASDREIISDVNQQAIEKAMTQADVSIMIHGHTHRPAIHEFELNAKPAKRIVLGDWYDQGSVLHWDQNGPELRSLER